jgi:hypothetical protein
VTHLGQIMLEELMRLNFPEVTRCNTRVRFIQPLKERIVREVGYPAGTRRREPPASRIVNQLQVNCLLLRYFQESISGLPTTRELAEAVYCHFSADERG